VNLQQVTDEQVIESLTRLDQPAAPRTQFSERLYGVLAGEARRVPRSNLTLLAAAALLVVATATAAVFGAGLLQSQEEPPPLVAPSPTIAAVSPTPNSTPRGSADATAAPSTLEPRVLSAEPVVEIEGACCITPSGQPVVIGGTCSIPRGAGPCGGRGVFIRTPSGQRWIDMSSIRGEVLGPELPVPVPQSFTTFGYQWVTYFATDPSRNTLVAYSGAGSVMAQIPVGELPDFVLHGSDAAWVSNLMDGTVSRIDAEALEVTDTISVGDSDSRPSAMVEAGDHVWVNTLDGVVAIDKETMEAAPPIDVGHHPCGITFALDRLWVGACGRVYSGITAMDPATRTVLGKVALAGYYHPTPGVAMNGNVWFLVNGTDESGRPAPLIAVDPITLSIVDSVVVDGGWTSITEWFGPGGRPETLWATGPRGVYHLTFSEITTRLRQP